MDVKHPLKQTYIDGTKETDGSVVFSSSFFSPSLSSAPPYGHHAFCFCFCFFSSFFFFPSLFFPPPFVPPAFLAEGRVPMKNKTARNKAPKGGWGPLL